MFSGCNFRTVFFFIAEHFEINCNCSILIFFSPLLWLQLPWAAGGASGCAGQQPAEGGSLLPPQSPARGLLEKHQNQHPAAQVWGLPWQKRRGPLQIPEHTSHGWVFAARLCLERIPPRNSYFCQREISDSVESKVSRYKWLSDVIGCQNPDYEMTMTGMKTVQKMWMNNSDRDCTNTRFIRIARFSEECNIRATLILEITFVGFHHSQAVFRILLTAWISISYSDNIFRVNFMPRMKESVYSLNKVV